MHKILGTIAGSGVIILFGLQNSDHVPVSLIFGSPTKVRLIFLLAVSAVFGFIISYIRGLRREIELKKQIRQLSDMYQDSLSKAEKRPRRKDDY